MKPHVRLRLGAPVALLVGVLAAGWSAAQAQSAGFLLITAPVHARISWVRLPENGNFAGLRPETLLDEGLRHPQGICVDKKRRRLFVADPDAQKIFAYQLSVVNGALVTDGRQSVVTSGVESRWVAVDGAGNIFFSDEPQNRILRVPAAGALRGDAKPEVVYSGDSVPEVNEPGAVAVDNLHVFWTNKHFGTEVGTLVRGSENPPQGTAASSSLAVLAKNSVKSYGVCIAMGNVFFTDAEKHLYGVKKHGGPVVEVSSVLDKPRGCAWDGDGTVFVADRGLGRIYSLPSNMHILSQADLTVAFDFDDAFGLAVLTGFASRMFSTSPFIALMSFFAVMFANAAPRA